MFSQTIEDTQTHAKTLLPFCIWLQSVKSQKLQSLVNFSSVHPFLVIQLLFSYLDAAEQVFFSGRGLFGFYKTEQCGPSSLLEQKENHVAANPFYLCQHQRKMNQRIHAYLFLSSENLELTSLWICGEQTSYRLVFLFCTHKVYTRTCSWRGRCTERRLALQTAAHPQREAGRSETLASFLLPGATSEL